MSDADNTVSEFNRIMREGIDRDEIEEWTRNTMREAREDLPYDPELVRDVFDPETGETITLNERQAYMLTHTIAAEFGFFNLCFGVQELRAVLSKVDFDFGDGAALFSEEGTENEAGELAAVRSLLVGLSSIWGGGEAWGDLYQCVMLLLAGELRQCTPEQVIEGLTVISNSLFEAISKSQLSRGLTDPNALAESLQRQGMDVSGAMVVTLTALRDMATEVGADMSEFTEVDIASVPRMMDKLMEYFASLPEAEAAAKAMQMREWLDSHGKSLFNDDEDEG